jgi:hypothetical protein
MADMAGILLSRARAEHCRWLICEAVEPRKGEPKDAFGGQRVCGAAVSWPTSYCPAHRRRVYERAPAVSPARDGSVRRAPPAADRHPDLMEMFG